MIKNFWRGIISIFVWLVVFGTLAQYVVHTQAESTAFALLLTYVVIREGLLLYKRKTVPAKRKR